MTLSLFNTICTGGNGGESWPGHQTFLHYANAKKDITAMIPHLESGQKMLITSIAFVSFVTLISNIHH